MLTPVDAVFEKHLQYALSYFTSDRCPAANRMPEDRIRSTFGVQSLQPGVYAAHINTANLALRDVLDEDRDHQRDKEWMSKITYGIADTPEQAITYVKYQGIPCPCVMTMFGVRRNTPERKFAWDKFGPEIGSKDGDIAYVWHLHPLDPAKLESEFGIVVETPSDPSTSPGP